MSLKSSFTLNPAHLRHLFGCVFVVLCVVFAIPAGGLRAAVTRANDVKVMFYDKWQTMPDDSLLRMGDRYMDREMYDSTLVCYSVLANRYYEHDRLTDRQADKCIVAMNRLGYLYHFYLYDYQKAYGYLHLAEKLSYKYGNKKHLPYILRDIAGIFKSYDLLYDPSGREDDDDLGLYGKAFRAAVDIKDWDGMTQNFINMLDGVGDKDDLDRLAEATDIFRSLEPEKDTISLYEYASCMYDGYVALYAGNYDEALRFFSEMEKNINPDRISSVRYLLQAKSKRSMAYFMMKRDSDAIAELKELETLAKRHNVIDVEVNLYEVLSRYYKDHGDDRRSMQYRMLYLNAKDSIATRHNLIKVKEMKFLNELDSINEEMRQLVYKRKMERYVTAGVSIIAVLLLLIVIILIRNYRQLKIKNRSIYERSKEALAAERAMRELLDRNSRDMQEQGGEQEARYQSSDLDDSGKKEIAGRIRFIMDNSDEIFQEGFSIDQLASLADVKKRYVSQVINEQFGKTFTVLLCDYRIKEACRRINDTEKYGRYTIGAIAMSVGFKSQSNFVNNFKRVMGLTPSEYQKQAKG